MIKKITIEIQSVNVISLWRLLWALADKNVTEQKKKQPKNWKIVLG